MVNRNAQFGDDGSSLVLAVDMEECRDLMLACMMTRMQTLGWSECDARLACDKAIEKCCDSLPKVLARVARICGNAVTAAAPETVVRMLARAEFAVGGIEIADELNTSRIAGMN
jgi:hypothetical protein